MAGQKVTLTVMNPRGESEIKTLTPPAPRLKDLKGKRIGIIAMRIQAGEKFIPMFQQALKDRSPETEWQTWDLPIMKGPDFRAEKIKEIAENSDGVIIALAISGGSTTRITPDAIQIEKLGTPVALVLTRCFRATARFIARSQGLEDLAFDFTACGVV